MGSVGSCGSFTCSSKQPASVSLCVRTRTEPFFFRRQSSSSRCERGAEERAGARQGLAVLSQVWDPAVLDIPADRLDSLCKWNREAKLRGRRTDRRKRKDFI